MAKVKGPLFSQEASGSFGDIVFLRRGGRNIARTRVSPANPNTPLQEAARDNLSGLSQAWRFSEDYDPAVASASEQQTLRQIDRSTDPATITDVLFDNLAESEKETWSSFQSFVGTNADRLSRNLDPIRTAP